MDWQTKMNHALNYIEENLTDEIKLDIAAQIVGCSVWVLTSEINDGNPSAENEGRHNMFPAAYRQ